MRLQGSLHQRKELGVSCVLGRHIHGQTKVIYRFMPFDRTFKCSVQHEFKHLTHTVGAGNVGHEITRRYRSGTRTLPTNQSLSTDQSAGSETDLWLVMEFEFTLRYGLIDVKPGMCAGILRFNKAGGEHSICFAMRPRLGQRQLALTKQFFCGRRGIG